MDNEYIQFAKRFEMVSYFSGKTICITGATGLIGYTMVKCLDAVAIEHNIPIQIICPVRDCEKARQILPSTVEICDICQLPLVDLSIDYLVHGASPTASKYFVEHPVETIEESVSLTRMVLDLSRAHSIKSAVYLSSMETYGVINEGIDVKEEVQGYIDPLNVRSSYSMGKRLCELLCHSYSKEYNVPIKIARLAQTFGSRINASDNRVFAQFARSIAADNDIELHTRGLSSRPFVYSLDAVSAILYILCKGADGQAYNVANEKTYISIIHLAEYLCREFGHKSQVKICPKTGMGYAPETYLNLNTTKLKELGWSCIYDMHDMFQNLIKGVENDIV